MSSMRFSPLRIVIVFMSISVFVLKIRLSFIYFIVAI